MTHTTCGPNGYASLFFRELGASDSIFDYYFIVFLIL